MTGAELGQRATAIAEGLYLAAFDFTGDARRARRKGWVDFVFVGPRGLIFREVKGDGDQLTGEQRAVGYALAALGLNWATWTTGDLVAGRIWRDLDAIASPPRKGTRRS